MKQTFLILISLIFFSTIFGQENFDYHKDFKRLLEQSQDSSSVYFYSNLLDRFNKNDSTLTDFDMIALQIGFTKNQNYRPYQTIDIEREIKSLINQKKYEDAISKCNEFLNTNPVNFTALMEKGFAYMKLKNDSALYYKQKFMKILNSIKVSGNGTIDKPYFVLSPIDGQTLITHIFGGSIGMMGSGHDPNGYFVDILEMIKEGKEPVTLYFNINHATEKMFSEEDLKNMEDALKKMDKKDNITNKIK
jgi:tetratricopeptide (TPR) repeat protein